MSGVCPRCGRPWSDALFRLACGCVLDGHSESDPALKFRDGVRGSLYCATHNAFKPLVDVVVSEASRG